MQNKFKERYVSKGQDKFIRNSNKFEKRTEDYNIMEDIRNIEPNINFAQLCKINLN